MNKINILIKFLGLVFLMAGLHRIYYKTQREEEMNILLKLPKYTDFLIMLIEISAGILLIMDCYVINVLYILLIMTSLGLLLLLYNHYEKILNTYNELFTLKADSLSVFLHITYIIIMIYIILVI